MIYDRMEEYLLHLALIQWSNDYFGPPETARNRIVLQHSYTVLSSSVSSQTDLQVWEFVPHV